jgi:hypothetical protein
MIDNKMSFGPQSAALCSKINSKTFLLSKSLYLFTEDFKPNLFKIFIQSHFDYCSTLTTHFSNQLYPKNLELCFTKSIFRILKIKLKEKSIKEQFDLLSKFNILPLKLRHFFRLCTFIFNILKNKNPFFSDIYNAQKKKNARAVCSIFNIPIFQKSFKQFSFSTISIKILNLFIFKCFTASQSLTSFKTFLHDDLIRYYVESEIFWT